MKKWINQVLTLLLILSVTSLTACSGKNESATPKESSQAASPPIVIKFSHVVTADSPKGQAAIKFKELLEQKTSGKVKVEVYPSSQLYGDKDELEALQSGNVQIIAPSTSKLVGLNPSFQVNDLPYLFKDKNAVHKFWDGDLGNKLMNSLDSKNIKGLATWDLGFKEFTSSKPIQTVNDFKGQKFRTQAGTVLEAQFKALGAAGATIAFSEVYTALQQGTVDGEENTWTSISEQKYEEVQKYLLESNHGRIDYIALTNKEWYDKLPADIKKAFDESMVEATNYERSIVDKLDNEAKDKLKKSGKFKFVEMSKEEQDKMQKLMEKVQQDFEDKIGKEYIQGAKKL
jgi:C4-dicarboxylate-binding protein DctP